MIIKALHLLGREWNARTKGPLQRLLYDPVLDGPPVEIHQQREGECGNPQCSREVRAKGLCSRCYQRERAHGDPTVVLQNSGPRRRSQRVLGNDPQTYFWPVEFVYADKSLTIIQEHPNETPDLPERILLDLRQMDALRDFLAESE